MVRPVRGAEQELVGGPPADGVRGAPNQLGSGGAVSISVRAVTPSLKLFLSSL